MLFEKSIEGKIINPKNKLKLKSEIELGIKGEFKKSIDEYIDGEIKTLEDELSELIKTKQKINIFFILKNLK